MLRQPGADTLGRLLDGWLGPGRASDLTIIPEPEIPAALNSAHAALARHPDTFVQNRLVPLGDLEDVDGRTAFLIENQNVCTWSYETAKGAETDPPVWQTCDDVPRLEGISLSGFLIEAVLIELILGHSVHAIDRQGTPEQIEAVLARLEAVPLAPMTWPTRSAFYAGPGTIAMTNDGPDGRPDWIWLGAIDEAAFAPFASLIGWPDDRWE